MAVLPDTVATLDSRINARLDAAIDPAVQEFAEALALDAGAVAVLFYGSNLRTGSLDGVLDFYVLLPGKQQDRIWPRVSYHERAHKGQELRAKVATMALSTFVSAASGELADTTIWARFVQPSALAWAADDAVRGDVVQAIAAAAKTAARLAVALGPATGTPQDYWRALFRATYKAEFRVEKAGRENDILAVNETHFAGLLPLALDAGRIAFRTDGERLTPSLSASERKRIQRWWRGRQRLGKPLNFARLAKASTTFEGAARYAAWKIERHTGMPVEVTPFRERHPLLAAPGVLWALRAHRRRSSS
jgi:hypothetical protein